jgi:gas vesicle protein
MLFLKACDTNWKHKKGCLRMFKGFVRGVLVGVGIGLLVAPMRGEEMRRMLQERFQELRGYLPENDQLNQYVSQVSDRVSQTSSNLKDYAQQAASKVKETGSTLGDLAQQSASEVKQTGQDVAQTTKQAAKTSTQNTSTSSTTYSNPTYGTSGKPNTGTSNT